MVKKKKQKKDNPKHTSEWHCMGCGKLLAKQINKNTIEIKCRVCNAFTYLNVDRA